MPTTQTRRAMLGAAAEEFLVHGYAGSSLAVIAARLGLTKGALAHHFPTKDALAAGLMTILRQTLADQEAAARRAYPDSGARAVVALVLGMAARGVEDPRVAASVVLLSDRSAPSYEIADVIADWVARIQGLIEQGRELGEVGGRLSAHEVAEHILVTAVGSAFLGSRIYFTDRDRKRLRFMRVTLTAVGVTDADDVVDGVLATRANGMLTELPPSMGLSAPS
ncbi:TetR/AcrR family transcriptional regulator [Georgenia faecalis]|uniref:TetR family transcriptional regulator n=1 Tax=Georgenia faecalis TaxID=2483799 RepID=A0ABV9DAZ5_9MICO|nr:TetR/AcrR family transcriptional regulator [Georgenia faecalis]